MSLFLFLGREGRRSVEGGKRDRGKQECLEGRKPGWGAWKWRDRYWKEERGRNGREEGKLRKGEEEEEEEELQSGCNDRAKRRNLGTTDQSA